MAFMALFISSAAFAASDYLLEIEGIKGECTGKHIKLTENADGSWTAENIPSGTYKLMAIPVKAGISGTTSRLAQKTVIDFGFTSIVSPRDLSTGQSSGKRLRRQQNMMAIQKSVTLEPGGVFISEIVVTKVQDDATDGAGTTEKTQKVSGYDLKLEKKV